jgi:glucokinase
LQNDADSAAYAEARFGAGRGFNPVMYLTIGSGIGGGLVLDGKIYRGAGSGAMEIGHLRPGQLPRHVPTEGETIESIGSGFGITARAKQAISGYKETVAFVRAHHRGDPRATGDNPDLQAKFSPVQDRFARLWEACQGNPDSITTQMIGECAKLGDRLSLELLADAAEAIGWGIAQAITLINPARVVIGGGVSLLGEEPFFEPVRRRCRKNVFGPFAEVAQIVPAALGEEVVIYGAVAIAAGAFQASSNSAQ